MGREDTLHDTNVGIRPYRATTVDPTPGHIVALVEQMRREGVKIVVRELHYPATLATTVAQRTGATLVALPAIVGGVPEAKDYLSFIEYNIRTMLKAVQGGAS